MWTDVKQFWTLCTKSGCRYWWCLCCNIWVCWVAAVIYTIVALVTTVVVLLIIAAIFTSCLANWFFFGWLLGEKVNVQNPFTPDPPRPSSDVSPQAQGEPVNTPRRMLRIIIPTYNAAFNDGDTVPITFTAIVMEADGSLVTDLPPEWILEPPVSVPVPSETHHSPPQAPAEVVLGSGLTIASTVARWPQDLAANTRSLRYVSASVVYPDGQRVEQSIAVWIGPAIN